MLDTQRSPANMAALKAAHRNLGLSPSKAVLRRSSNSNLSLPRGLAAHRNLGKDQLEPHLHPT
jgi:hypothetical protein